MARLEEIVDALSARLDRPVLIDDPELEPVAYSRHWGAIDDVRRESILVRGAPPRARAALFAQGIRDAREPVRTSGDASLGMDARVCVPIRGDGRLVGYLWMLDDGTITDADLAAAVEAGRAAARPLAARHEDARATARRDLAALLTGGDDEARAAAGRLRGDDPAGARAHTVGALTLTPARPEAIDALERELDRLGRASERWGVRWCVLGEQHVVLLTARPATEQSPARALPELLAGAADALRGRWRARLRIGTGGTFADLLGARRSLREARIALELTGARERARRWDELGSLQLVAQLPRTRDDVPAPVRTLLDDPGRAHLAQTLERYLELAGDARATAEELGLHRATVYHRLARAEELTGCDLSRGDDRLLLHLGLKLARLVG